MLKIRIRQEVVEVKKKMNYLLFLVPLLSCAGKKRKSEPKRYLGEIRFSVFFGHIRANPKCFNVTNSLVISCERLCAEVYEVCAEMSLTEI